MPAFCCTSAARVSQPPAYMEMMVWGKTSITGRCSLEANVEYAMPLYMTKGLRYQLAFYGNTPAKDVPDGQTLRVSRLPFQTESVSWQD